MPGPDPFDLPEPVLEAAMSALVAEDGNARRAAVAGLVAAHPEHREGLMALWNALAGADRALEQTFVVPPEPPPEIDGYRVLRKLGEGAFGIVYLCEQREPIHRQVALKLLRPGAGDRATLARFESERRFLARLHHPTIAQIFNAGLLPDGRPWFAMEHVPGVPITRWCDHARMPLAARLRLFARLCQGVQHAHDQGIVHRDLKPANVLVVELDGEAQPKIIDFGIARALERPDGGEQRTETGRVVGTPGYMSPEQAAGRLDEVDARSDLWSLGVLLHELLTGVLPWDTDTDAAFRTDREPQRPSRRIAADRDTSGEVAQRRGTDPRRLAASLRGDLDWIVLKALARERSRRYVTALELAADVHRHLRGEPVLAGPPSFAYRLRKLVHRHRTALAAAAAVAVFAAAGLWLLSGYRAEAHSRGEDADAAVASLLARANDPALTLLPNTAEVRKVLAADALAFYERFLREHPTDTASLEGRARTLWTLSQVHWLLGRFGDAERIGREAVADSEALLATAPAKATFRCVLANAERVLGRAIYSRGDREAARPWFQRAVDRLESCQAETPPLGGGLLASALLELRTTLADHEVALVDATLARAAQVQAEEVRRAGDAPREVDGLVTIELNRCNTAANRGDLGTARQELHRLEAWVAAGKVVTPGNVMGIHCFAARVAEAAGDLDAATAAYARAEAAGRAWCATDRAKPQPLRQFASVLLAQAGLHESARRTDAALGCLREAAALGESWSARFPEDPNGLMLQAQAVYSLNRSLLKTGRRSSLAGAEGPARQIAATLRRAAAAQPGDAARMAWVSLGTLGLIADALAFADADAIWEDTAAAMADYGMHTSPDAGVAGESAFYTLRAARRRLAAGRAEAAAALVDAYERLQDDVPEAIATLSWLAPDAWHLRAMLALRERDFATAATCAEEAGANGRDFRAPVAAADAMTAVWLAERAADATGTPAHRDRAITMCERAVHTLSPKAHAGPEDLWVAVPNARMWIRLAQALHDRDDTFDADQVRQAVALLAAVRAEVHANEWDESVLVAGRALLAK